MTSQTTNCVNCAVLPSARQALPLSSGRPRSAWPRLRPIEHGPSGNRWSRNARLQGTSMPTPSRSISLHRWPPMRRPTTTSMTCSVRTCRTRDLARPDYPRVAGGRGDRRLSVGSRYSDRPRSRARTRPFLWERTARVNREATLPLRTRSSRSCEPRRTRFPCRVSCKTCASPRCDSSAEPPMPCNSGQGSTQKTSCACSSTRASPTRARQAASPGATSRLRELPSASTSTRRRGTARNTRIPALRKLVARHQSGTTILCAWQTRMSQQPAPLARHRGGPGSGRSIRSHVAIVVVSIAVGAFAVDAASPPEPPPLRMERRPHRHRQVGGGRTVAQAACDCRGRFPCSE